jgi:hypothetical protein
MTLQIRQPQPQKPTHEALSIEAVDALFDQLRKDLGLPSRQPNTTPVAESGKAADATQREALAAHDQARKEQI